MAQRALGGWPTARRYHFGTEYFGSLWRAAQQIIFPAASANQQTLNAVAQLGDLMLLLLAGMQTDLGLVKRVRRTAAIASATGSLFPSAYTLREFLPESLLPDPNRPSAFLPSLSSSPWPPPLGCHPCCAGLFHACRYYSRFGVEVCPWHNAWSGDQLHFSHSVAALMEHAACPILIVKSGKTIPDFARRKNQIQASCPLAFVVPAPAGTARRFSRN